MNQRPHDDPILRGLIESLSGRQLCALAGPEMLFITQIGNFAYLSGEYGGDNTLRPFSGSSIEWLESIGHDQCRDKGLRLLAHRLWPDWEFVPADIDED